MPDRVNAEERAAIEAALERGAVTKVAPGVSGLPQPRYDAKSGTWHSVCGLTGRRLSKGEAQRRWNAQNGWKTSLAIRSRRAKVRHLAPTKTAREIAEILGILERVVRDDCRAMGIKPQPEQRRTVRVAQGTVDAARARAERVRECTDAKVRAVVKPGLSLAEIARRAGVNEKTAKLVFERNGWTTPAERRRNEARKAA